MEKLKSITIKHRTGCPVCGGVVVSRCRCRLAESTCENGHHWHCCGVHHTVVIGKRDDNLPMNVCTCNLSSNEEK